MKLQILIAAALLMASVCPVNGQSPNPIINGVPAPWTFSGPGVSQSGNSFTFSGGTTTNPVTFAASSGASPGTTFNGSAAVTVDYHTLGAAAAFTCSSTGTTFTPATGDCITVTASVSATLQAASNGFFAKYAATSAGSLALTSPDTMVSVGGGCSISGAVLTVAASTSAVVWSDGTAHYAACATSLPSGTTNQMLYYAGAGTTVTPLTLGTNLSISSGTLNASATAATAWSAITGGTNAGQALLVGTGSSLATTGTGTITATNITATTNSTLTTLSALSLPYSQVTGAIVLAVPTVLDTTTPVTVSTSNNAEYHNNQNATAATAIVYDLPTAAAGKQFCFTNSYNGSAANTGTLELLTSATGQFVIFTDGTLSATGGYVISGGAASDAACVVGVDSTHWQLYSQRGTWTKH